ncbi:hypothetical protein BCR44DRAFT_116630 [Catenaria anguillulae PL171]|uniref:NADPH--cytochrome P450 reductase n=1 Tax=Catenaria anguillulae PL171 TaxID=765915 RepID=A0A1Y2HQ03_9FUNG|nr:hypothetical protein BCR44DRAFT_116630 [Catenaria anguillulae PL171]
MAQSSPFLDTTDLIILGTLVLGGAYWLLRTGKPSDPRSAGGPPGAASAAPRSRSPTDSAAKTLDAKYTKDGKDIVILYGSQTGTGEEYAARLAKDGAKYGLNCLAADPEDFDMEDMAKIPRDKLLIFVLATYGEGEPTDNAVGLNEYLMNAAQEHASSAPDEKPLAGLHYAVFGLGNKTYEQFNAMARNVDKWCTALGGVRVGPRGEGDDDDNMEEDFVAWRDALWPEVAKVFKLDLQAAAAKALAAGLSQRSYALTELAPQDVPPFVYRGELGDPKLTTYDAKNPFYATVVRTKELFSGKEVDRNCVHMEFELKGSWLTYQAGDHLALWPENETREVTALAQALGLTHKLDTVISMKATDPASRKKHPFPCPTTFRAALTHYLDIGVPPKQHIVQAWLPYCEAGSVTREYYESIAADKDRFAAEVTDRHATVADLLLAHPIPKLPVDLVLETFTRIQPRYYSISSSPKYVGSNTIVHITATVLRYQAAKGGKKVQGLATRFLYDIHERMTKCGASGIKVPVTIRHAAFKLPRQNAVPVIMVGPGTGVAPFRGFVQDRCATAKRLQDSANGSPVTPLGEAILFFGCRYQAHDYLYADEWADYMQQGGLSGIVTAFSRDGPNKVYVQHRLAERADQMWELVSRKGAHIYVCGDAKNMARDVQQFFIGLARDKGGLPEDKAQRFVKDLRNKGRYQEDVWS